MNISVVVPTLNEEKFLPRSLHSLKKQNYRGKYEIIVVDNGSTDKTAQIARGFGVKVISCVKRGVILARQTGVNHATGKIIIQADADTFYPPDWLFKISQPFSSNPQVVAVAGRFFYSDPPSWANAEYKMRNFGNR